MTQFNDKNKTGIQPVNGFSTGYLPTDKRMHCSTCCKPVMTVCCGNCQEQICANCIVVDGLCENCVDLDDSFVFAEINRRYGKEQP